MRMPMIAMTIISSISVKPLDFIDASSLYDRAELEDRQVETDHEYADDHRGDEMRGEEQPVERGILAERNGGGVALQDGPAIGRAFLEAPHEAGRARQEHVAAAERLGPAI